MQYTNSAFGGTRLPVITTVESCLKGQKPMIPQSKISDPTDRILCVAFLFTIPITRISTITTLMEQPLALDKPALSRG